MGDAANFTRALLGQGLGMGWGDEAEAWLRSKIGEKTYEENLRDINREYAEYAQRNPLLTAGTEFAGGVLPMVASYAATPFTGGAAAPAAAATTARTAGALARLAQNPVVRGALTGLGTGAVAGAGTAEPGSRGEGALVGGTVGTIVGGGAPVVIRGAGNAAGWLRDRLAPSEEVIRRGSTRRVNRALGQAREGEGMTAQEAADVVAADRARGIPSTLANVDPSMVDLAETAAQRTGVGARQIEGTLGRQTAGARERVYGRVRSEINGGNYYDDEMRMVEELRNQARTLYDDAYAFGEVSDPRIRQILESPQFRSFYNRAREIADNERLAAQLRGEDTSRFDLNPIYMVDSEGNAVVQRIPDVRTLDYIKRGIDATIERGFDGQGLSTAEANALRQVRREFVNVIDEATIDPNTGVSAYTQARAGYAGDMEVLDALRAGRNDFNRLDHEEIARMIQDMSEAERDAFRTGAVRNIYDRLMDPSGNINAAQRIIGSPEYAAKMAPLFDSPAQFDLFRSAMQREMQLFQQSNRILGGAATARRTQARGAFEEGTPVGEVVADTITGSFGSSLTNLVARIARSATMTDDIATDVSRMLMSSDPTEVAAAVRILEDYGQQAATGAARLNRAETGAIMGTVVSAQPAPTTDEAPNVAEDIARETQTRIDQGGPDIQADLEALRRSRAQTAEPRGLNLTIDEPADARN